MPRQRIWREYRSSSSGVINPMVTAPAVPWGALSLPARACAQMPLPLLLVLVCLSLTAQENRYEGFPIRSVSLQPAADYLEVHDLEDKLAALKTGQPLR